MKLFLITFLIIICSKVSFAQINNNAKNQSLLFEFGQTGLIYNLSYDHTFHNKRWGLRAQVGSNLVKYLPLFKMSAGGFTLIGNQKHFLELGANAGYINVNEVSDDQRGVILFYPDFPLKSFFANADIGYRNYGKKTIFRVGFAPLVFKEGFVPGGYLGFGFRF